MKPHNNKYPQSDDMPDPDVSQELGNLRKNIDAIDEKIVALLSDRQGIVEQVVSLKKAHNLPIYHPAREEDLISGRRRQGREAGLNPDFVEDLYRTIIRRSRVEQASQMSLKSVRPGAVILIVGGKGHMGSYFRKWFADAGYEVRSLDKDEWADAETLCRDTDLVILSVPINLTCKIARQISPYLPKKAVLADITSLKEVPVKAMLDSHPGPVLGLHPLFGSSTSTLDKQIIVATPGREDSSCQWILDQFVSWGSIIVRADAREHDEIMHIVQALRHFATFTFGSFLSRRKVELSRTLEFSSPIYRLEIGMVGRLFAQDPSLYYEIIMASPQRRTLLKEYVASMNENIELLEKEDKSLFQGEFMKIAEWFGPFSDQAMRESTYLINKLIERF
ncbi:bifunctional chorismate mutase/prephenate dehydrogenase [Desulfococcaceae bacterium HSG8]|nr:bifunctional chorismate mutase/prephenate dehydrogenase [Desulfococcaceae bacterium HSG8]